MVADLLLVISLWMGRVRSYEGDYFMVIIGIGFIICFVVTFAKISFHGGAARHFLHRFGFEPQKCDHGRLTSY
jgi:hypothetical protein